MDIKAIQSQALTSMNSQNTEIQKTDNQVQKVQKEQENDPVKEKITPEKLQEAANELNKKLDMLNSQLKIEIDKDTGIQIVKIIDKDTKEVIRQIPPEAVLKVARYLNEVVGLLFDAKV